MLTVAAGPGVEQRLGNAVCRLDIDALAIELSGELAVTVSIEGQAPVEVEPPRPLTRSNDWRVRAMPPKTTPLADGRERWLQTFRLEPFQAGPRVPLPFEPLRFRTGNEVRDWLVTWDPVNIRVTTTVPGADLGHARSVTGIEQLPALERSPFPWWIVVAFLAVALVAVALAAILVRGRRTPGPRLSPLAHALAEIHHLESAGITAEALPQVADIVRGFLEAQLQLQATRQTTAEFLASVRTTQALPDERVEQLSDLLRRCDLVKFAGERPTPEECVMLLDIARQTITEISLPAQSAESTKTLSTK